MQLQRLSVNDGVEFYNMIKRIGRKENSFTNPVHDMNFDQYKEWLLQQDDWANERNIPNGYTGQTIYWLVVNNIPIGIGKIRHALTPASMINGGNIGYAIDPLYRGRGFGSQLLMLLIDEAKKKQIGEIILTIDKGNFASKRVAEKNGAICVGENQERWYYSIK